MPEMTTVPARVKANSVNSEPTRPPIKPMGAYTATRVVVMAMMGVAISRAPLMAASNLDSPCSICRCTFSTMMMASSTTRPMASTMDNRVSRFREKPNISMTKAPPISDSGTATEGTTEARTEPRHRNTTTSTMSMASIRVRITSLMESSIKSEAS